MGVHLWHALKATRRRLAVLMLAATVGACGVVEEQQRRQQALVNADRELNQARVLMSTGDFTIPYKAMGYISYSEPFSPDAIDTAHVNARLRQLAINRYHDDVDAIIYVNSDVNDDGTIVTASGEAIRINGACAFCRHKEPNEAPVAPNYDYSGIWRGTATTLRPNGGAIRTITLSLIQNGSKLTGAYRCSADRQANAHCRNLDETGSVRSGRISGNRFQASITLYPDYAHCLYMGDITLSRLLGGYICFISGMFVEGGRFALERGVERSTKP